MYISLKEGWFPLSDLCIKYEKDKGNMNRILEKISDSDKEKIGNTWIIRESEFVKNIKTDKNFEKDDREELNEIVDKFTSELSKKLSVNTVRSKFIINNTLEGDYVIKTFLEWSIKCQINFPIKVYEYMEEEELYTKCLLIQQLWNKILKLQKLEDGEI